LAPATFGQKTIEGSFKIAATDYAQQVVLPELISRIRIQALNLRLIVRDFELDILH
jgi:hypothetical protein